MNFGCFRVFIGLLLCLHLVLHVAPVGGRKVRKRCKPLTFPDTVRSCDQEPNADGWYRDGTVCNFACRLGCVKDTGGTRRVCKVKGRSKWWTGGRGLKCRCSPCVGAPSHPEGYTSDCGAGTYPAGHTCVFTCPAGYVRASGNERKICVNSHWRGEDLVCEATTTTQATTTGATTTTEETTMGATTTTEETTTGATTTTQATTTGVTTTTQATTTGATTTTQATTTGATTTTQATTTGATTTTEETTMGATTTTEETTTGATTTTQATTTGATTTTQATTTGATTTTEETTMGATTTTEETTTGKYLKKASLWACAKPQRDG
ncbi:uncharacterized protein LOC144910802 isoform X1 [Branchiostoma floridae x Branchiostoma belcheri]